MADRNRYQDRPRRERGEDEGFFERVKDWFNREIRNENRDYSRDYGRDYRDYGRGYRGENRDYDQQQSYRSRVYDTENRRDFGQQGSWRDRDNLRPWRANQGEDWDDNYGSTGSHRYGYGRSYDQEYRSRGGDPSRGGESGRGGYEDDDQGYGNFYGSEYGSRYSRDYDRGDYRSRYSDRSSSRQPLGWEYEDSGTDWEYDRPYPTAGMRSDYNEEENWRGENRGRSMGNRYTGGRNMGSRYTGDRYSGSRYDYERDYGDYVGYDSEGAFYQDLDNPYTSEYWEVWVVPGEFTGYGPSNYRRSDERITDDVCERLTRHGRLDASEIEVKVQEGAVTLTGSVPDREMKRMAEDTAETVSGVQEVNNQIRVTRREGEGEQYRYGRQRGQQRGTEFRDRDRDYGRGQSVDRDYNNQQDWSTSNVETGESSMRDTTSAATQPVTDKRLQLRKDMEVIGSDGKLVGRVKEIRTGDFLVDREMARDVFVPHGSIESVGAQVMLRVKHDEVDNQGWETPDLLGS